MSDIDPEDSETVAHRYVRAIEAEACRKVAGYEAAPWGIDDERSNVVSISALIDKARAQR